MKKYFNSSKFKRYNNKRKRKSFKKKYYFILNSKRKNLFKNSIRKFDSLHNSNYIINREIKPIELHSGKELSLSNGTATIRLINKLNLAGKKLLEIKAAGNTKKIIILNLKQLEFIDFSSSCAIKATIDTLSDQNIQAQIKTPVNSDVYQKLANTRFFDGFVDVQGKRIKSNTDTERYEITEGDSTSEGDKTPIIDILTNCSEFLKRDCLYMEPIIGEIIENTISWSGYRKWFFSVYKKEDKVLFTILDLGIGILEKYKEDDYYSLRTYDYHLYKELIYKKPHEFLSTAFFKKIGSSSGERNRNKGLPFIYDNFTRNALPDLRVITNEATVYFERIEKSNSRKNASFSGTLYRWELTS